MDKSKHIILAYNVSAGTINQYAGQFGLHLIKVGKDFSAAIEAMDHSRHEGSFIFAGDSLNKMQGLISALKNEGHTVHTLFMPGGAPGSLELQQHIDKHMPQHILKVGVTKHELERIIIPGHLTEVFTPANADAMAA